MVLETGFVVLAVYISFFVVMYFGTDRMERAAEADSIYCQMAKVMAIMSVLMLIYNSAMRTEAGYMAYFVLSLPFIKKTAPIAVVNN